MTNHPSFYPSAEEDQINFSILQKDIDALDTEEILAKTHAQANTLIHRLKQITKPETLADVRLTFAEQIASAGIVPENWTNIDLLDCEGDLCQETAKYKQALKYFLTMAKLQIDGGGAPWGITCLKIAQVYAKSHEILKASYYYQLAIEIREKLEEPEEDTEISIANRARQGLKNLANGQD